MRRLPTYNRLTNQSTEDLNSSEDNLINGTDCTSYSNALRVGNLVRHILHQHIKYYDYQQWHNEQDPTAAATTSGAGATTTTSAAVLPTQTGTSSRLRKMWKRVKRVFRGGGGGRHRDQHLSLTNEEMSGTTTDDPGGGEVSSENTYANDSGPSTSSSAAARASTSTSAAAACSTGRSPGNSRRRVAIPHIYCGRYTNPAFVLKHCANFNQVSSGSGSGAGASYSSIKNGNVQQLDMKLKVQAWVSHLNNPTASTLTAALMSTSSTKGNRTGAK